MPDIKAPDCQVCNRSSEGRGDLGKTTVGSSPLGAFSVSYCVECLQNGAEPDWAVLCVLEMVNGDWDKASDFMKTVTVYKDGSYIPATTLKLGICKQCGQPTSTPECCIDCFEKGGCNKGFNNL